MVAWNLRITSILRCCVLLLILSSNNQNEEIALIYFIQFKSALISLNLTLNAIFQVDTWIFQMRQPVNTIQRFESSRIVQNDNVQIAYGLLLDGFIREMQNEIVQIIPLVIALIIKSYNRVGAADFFCEKFQNPTFDLFIMRWENNPTPCDEMIDMDL